MKHDFKNKPGCNSPAFLGEDTRKIRFEKERPVPWGILTLSGIVGWVLIALIIGYLA